MPRDVCSVDRISLESELTFQTCSNDCHKMKWKTSNVQWLSINIHWNQLNAVMESSHCDKLHFNCTLKPEQLAHKMKMCRKVSIQAALKTKSRTKQRQWSAVRIVPIAKRNQRGFVQLESLWIFIINAVQFYLRPLPHKLSRRIFLLRKRPVHRSHHGLNSS